MHSNFERYNRQTLAPELLRDPALTYDFCVEKSKAALSLAHHYDGYRVGVVAPAWDDGRQGGLYDGVPQAKLLSAGNFRPHPYTTERRLDVRVCAEQNLIDNALRIGDALLGVMFVRGPQEIKPLEGIVDGTEAIHMCGPCRHRALPILGTGFVVVSFRGDSTEPIEAITIRRQIEKHDFGVEVTAEATGHKAVKEFVVDRLKLLDCTKVFGRRPSMPSRLLPHHRRTQ